MESVRARPVVAGGLAAVALIVVIAAVVVLRPGAGPEATGPAPAVPVASPAPETVRIVESREIGERTRDLTIHSPALGRAARARVLLPRGWRPGSGPWPVLYLLHGCCDPDHLGWDGKGGADELTAGAPVIVVIPEGGSVGFYSDWLNGPRWETFHLTELLGVVEKEYGAGDRRAVAGLSMGGFGAMSYAARHPGMFQAAASFSGVLDTEAGLQGVMRLIQDNGLNPGDLWGYPGGDGDSWAAHNPSRLVSALKGVRLFVSAGNGEPGPLDGPAATEDAGERNLLSQSRTFTERARAAGLTVETYFYGKGTHTWPYWKRSLERALPGLLTALEVRPSGE
ncbi:alpha/beta hydrolase [Planomonospora corallina]|uniref:Alpha/beta hydrolase n=1 Tax=Planomonospora corallina TaxID=1806052 RepID=A0ABV8IHF6_9ACTN